jgi:hypothetical protein
MIGPVDEHYYAACIGLACKYSTEGANTKSFRLLWSLHMNTRARICVISAGAIDGFPAGLAKLRSTDADKAGTPTYPDASTENLIIIAPPAAAVPLAPTNGVAVSACSPPVRVTGA